MLKKENIRKYFDFDYYQHLLLLIIVVFLFVPGLDLIYLKKEVLWDMFLLEFISLIDFERDDFKCIHAHISIFKLMFDLLKSRIL